MTGPRPTLICLLSGVALSFSFPEPSIVPLAWVAIAPLLYVTREASVRRAAALTLVFGLGFFGSLLVWISAVGWIAWALLVAIEAGVLALFGAGWGVLRRLDRRWWPLLVPALWVAVEVVRAYVPVVGFPWGQLAQGQVAMPRVLYAARLGGATVVSALVVAVNVFVLMAVLAARARRPLYLVAAAGLLMVPVGFSLMTPSDDAATVMRVGMVQGNARPGVHVEDERARVDRHVELTRSIADRDLDLVVWPESAVGIDPIIDADVGEALSEAARIAGAPLITGANLEAPPDNYLVMALLLDESGAIVDTYQKTHLVPFGEYIPSRRYLEWIPMLDQVARDALAGEDIVNFAVGGHEVGTVISFEGDFGPLVRDRVAAGARVLVVATNTSTWKRTWASAQHVAMSQVRAAENRVPVVHAALSGISAAIDRNGRVLERTPLYEESTLVFPVEVATGISFYARTGEWFPWLCILAALAGLVASTRRGAVSTLAE